MSRKGGVSEDPFAEGWLVIGTYDGQAFVVLRKVVNPGISSRQQGLVEIDSHDRANEEQRPIFVAHAFRVGQILGKRRTRYAKVVHQYVFLAQFARQSTL
jgi:hypothetical protein